MMAEEQDGTNKQDGNRTGAGIDTPLTRSRSGPVLYQIMETDGAIHGPFKGLLQAQAYLDANPDLEWRDWEFETIADER